MIAKMVPETGRSMKSSGVSTRARLARELLVQDPAEHHPQHHAARAAAPGAGG